MLKRFFIRIIILLLLAIAVFFVGWINLRIHPGSYAVFISKTGGIKETVIKPGKFVWSFDALLPTNIRLLEFRMQSKTQTVELTGKLPSADAYRAFMAGNPDFSWELKASATVGYNPDYLPRLYKDLGISSDSMIDDWLAGMISSLMQKLQERLFAIMSDKIGALMDGELSDTLKSYLNSEFPMLVIENVTLYKVKIPDFNMYLTSQRLYIDYMQRFQKAVEPAIASAAANAVEEQIQLEQLKKYGELFREYPALIEYLAIKSGIAIPKK